ncbi:MAG: hypothetical protein R3C69_00185 [Geminicoccaceae bacterium]
MLDVDEKTGQRSATGAAVGAAAGAAVGVLTGGLLASTVAGAVVGGAGGFIYDCADRAGTRPGQAQPVGNGKSRQAHG